MGLSNLKLVDKGVLMAIDEPIEGDQGMSFPYVPVIIQEYLFHGHLPSFGGHGLRQQLQKEYGKVLQAFRGQVTLSENIKRIDA